MPSTSNKGLAVPVTGTESGTWGDVLNTQVMGYLDLMLGGTLSQALSAANVTLSAADARNAIVRFTGTLLANVIVTTPCLGFCIFDNQTTGNFTVTVQYTGGIGGTPTVAQGAASFCIIDATNGVRIVWTDPDLAAIAALSATSGILKKTAANTWSLNTGVTDLAATTANRIFGTDGSGVSGLITAGTAISIASSSVGVVAATQAQMESQSANPTFASVQKYHPGHPKAGGNLNGQGTPDFRSGDYGMGAVTDNGTGLYTLAFDTSFSDTNYWLTSWGRCDTVSTILSSFVSGQPGGTKTTGSISIQAFTVGGGSAGGNADLSEMGLMFFGDLP